MRARIVGNRTAACGSTLIVVLGLSAACSSEENVQGGAGGNGGQPATGGAGGSLSSGGSGGFGAFGVGGSGAATTGGSGGIVATGGSSGADASATGGSGGSATGGTGGGSSIGGAAGMSGAAGASSGVGGTGGSGATGGSDGGTLDCGTALGNNATCTTCLRANCCSAMKACNDTNCKDFVDCARACPNPNDTTSACVTACKPDALNISTFNAILLCMGQNCADTCSSL